MVEFALVFPILIVTIFALIEFGMYLKDALAIHFAELEATRTVAAEGTAPQSDSAALQVISDNGLLSLDFNNIEFVEVYKTHAANDPTPEGCNSLCTPAPHDMLYKWKTDPQHPLQKGWFTDTWGGALNSWTPNQRNDVIPTDVFGVHIQYHHYWVDPLLHSLTGNAGKVDIEQRMLMPVEPGCYSDDALFCQSQHGP